MDLVTRNGRYPRKSAFADLLQGHLTAQIQQQQKEAGDAANDLRDATSLASPAATTTADPIISGNAVPRRMSQLDGTNLSTRAGAGGVTAFGQPPITSTPRPETASSGTGRPRSSDNSISASSVAAQRSMEPRKVAFVDEDGRDTGDSEPAEDNRDPTHSAIRKRINPSMDALMETTIPGATKTAAWLKTTAQIKLDCLEDLRKELDDLRQDLLETMDQDLGQIERDAARAIANLGDEVDKKIKQFHRDTTTMLNAVQKGNKITLEFAKNLEKETKIMERDLLSKFNEMLEHLSAPTTPGSGGSGSFAAMYVRLAELKNELLDKLEKESEERYNQVQPVREAVRRLGEDVNELNQDIMRSNSEQQKILSLQTDLIKAQAYFENVLTDAKKECEARGKPNEDLKKVVEDQKSQMRAMTELLEDVYQRTRQQDEEISKLRTSEETLYLRIAGMEKGMESLKSSLLTMDRHVTSLLKKSTTTTLNPQAVPFSRPQVVDLLTLTPEKKGTETRKTSVPVTRPVAVAVSNAPLVPAVAQAAVRQPQFNFQEHQILTSHIPTFTGYPQDDTFDAFYDQIMAAVQQRQYPDDIALATLRNHIAGPAKEWMVCQDQRNTNKKSKGEVVPSFADMMQLMRERFCRISEDKEHRAKELKQKEDESADCYIDRKTTALETVGVTALKPVIHSLTNGILPRFQNEFKKILPLIIGQPSLAQAINIMRESLHNIMEAAKEQDMMMSPQAVLTTVASPATKGFLSASDVKKMMNEHLQQVNEHMAAFAAAQATTPRNNTVRRCYKCGSEEHMVATCPHLTDADREKQRQRRNRLDQEQGKAQPAGNGATPTGQ